jgi:energy-coupling factor transport system permease protein
MSDIYFGSFVQKKSFVHSLDARVKFFYVVILSVVTFSFKQPLELLVFSILILIVLYFSKATMRDVFLSLRRFIFVFLFIFLMYVIFSINKIDEGIIVLWRFLLLILISFVLTYTTPLPDLTAAIEKLSKPIRIFGVKPRNVAVMISIAIRFIPVMFVCLERLREGMLARLADFRRLSNIKILVIALLENMFASASTLSDAMMARLYNENAQSSRVMRLKRNDYISLVGFFLFLFLLTYQVML